MKRAACWLLFICFVFGQASSNPARPLPAGCTSRAWSACMADNIKVRADFFFDDFNKTCTFCEKQNGGPSNLTSLPLLEHVPFPPAQWIALRGVHVGNLSTKLLETFNPPSLVILALIHAEISTIENKVFADFPRLQSVHLDYNVLPLLKRTWFTGFQSPNKLTVDLSFSNNRIATLERGCFEETPYLQMLDLSWNLLSEVASGWFRGLSCLHTLVLNNNKIEVISESAFDSLVELRVLNLTRNSLACLSKRTLSGVVAPKFTMVGGQLLTEQDSLNREIDWNLTVNSTNFPWRKQEVRLRLDNLEFRLTYSLTKEFHLKWDTAENRRIYNHGEVEFTPLTFGPMHIRAPFVMAIAMGKRENHAKSTMYNLCGTAWGRRDGIVVALKGGASLQLVGIDPTKLLNDNGSIALVSSYDLTLVSKQSNGPATDQFKGEPRMKNISCFVFHRDGGLFIPNTFRGVEVEVDSECHLTKDIPNAELTTTPPNYQTADSRSTASENPEFTDVTLLSNLVENRLSPNKTFQPNITLPTRDPPNKTFQPNITLPTRDPDQTVLITVIVLSSALLTFPPLILFRAIIWNKNRNTAQNARDTGIRLHLAQSTICATSLIGNPMYNRSDQSSELHGTNVDVAGAAQVPQLAQSAICVASLINNPRYQRSDLAVRPPDINGRDETASMHSYMEINDEDIYDPSETHTYSDIKDEDVNDNPNDAIYENSEVN
uniref:LRRNT domain-containing protein n=1 Tax=Branchiostoma floridae TaxID=7739 RepID=C3YJ51_BRAFL|eukprot:XP_002603702.1 hypothetical protein BRAFLDRAFT_93091 [Branchiostoma floridae]